MAEENGTSSVVIQWSTLLALTAAVVGAVSRLTPLTSTRPADPVQGSRLSIGDQDVDARLWQDPFQAAAADREAAAEPARPGRTHAGNSFRLDVWLGEELLRARPAPPDGHDASVLQRQVSKAAPPAPAGHPPSLLVLPVMVEGEPYPDRAEQRVRTRVAVVTALALRRFYPRDAEHVGYVRIPWDVRSPAAKADPSADPAPRLASLVVPYEWFDGPSSAEAPDAAGRPWADGPAGGDPSAGGRRVLVLWLNESVMRDRLLPRLRDVFSAVLPPGVYPPSVAVRVIGPRISQTLRALCTSPTPAVTGPVGPDWLQDAQFLAPTPTADDDWVGYPPVARGGDRAPNIVRTTLTDGKLCDALVAELGRRGVDASPAGRAHVAVITEFDTFYGRQLESSFRRAAAPRMDAADWIQSFHYLRGVDGQAATDTKPPSSKGSEAAEKPDRVNLAGLLNPPAEQTEGASQVDYLRRLATQLRDRDQALRKVGQRLRAVGVLGNDVYDKLLVLRALRHELPGCLFFTTGLDARYGLATEWEATHNLIVASDYGLTLDPIRQGAVPPFRDSSQTSLFATVLAAAERPWASASAASDYDPLTARGYAPRLFEVGRGRFFDLTVPTPRPPPELAGARLYPEREDGRLHPERVDESLVTTWQSHAWLSALLVLLAAWIIAWSLGVRPAKIRWLRLLEMGSPILLLALLAGAGVVAILSRADWPVNEPLSLGGGVSVWPSVVLRLGTAALALSLVRKTWATARRNDRAMSVHFALTPPSPARQRLAAFRAAGRWARWLRWWDWSRLRAGRARRVRLLTLRARRAGRPPRSRLWSWWHDARRDWRRDWRRLTFGRWPVYFHAAVPGSPANADPGSPVPEDARISTSPHACGPTAKNVDATAIWREFQFRAGLGPRLARTAVAAGLYLVLTYYVIQAFGYPSTPARGAVARTANDASGWLAGVASVVLLFFVLDAMYLNKRLIDYLGKQTTRWPQETLARFRRPNVRPSDLTEYVDVRFIAERTRVVGDAAYYPFPVFFLLITSRIALFDDWDWPAGLLVVYLACIGLAILAALMLRWAAEDARGQARRLVDARIRREEQATADAHLVADRDRHLERTDALRSLRQQIEQEREGAFSILSNYPVVAAVLLPSGGVGLWALLDQLPRLFG